MSSFEDELRLCFEGEMHFDAISRKVYSVDASIFEIEPIGIVLPKHKEDIIYAVRTAKKHGIPLIPRGAATGIAGGCIGRGLIIDLSKFLNRIIHLDMIHACAICEPGVIQDQLNNALASKGYRLGPDTSTGNRATLGGMVANNAAGARSLHYGKMVDVIQEVEIVLADGELVRFGEVDEITIKEKCAQNNTEGIIYREVCRIRQQYGTLIESTFPKLPRRVSGYNLDEILPSKPLNIAKLIAGSEGTLGIITEITVSLAKHPRVTGLSIIHFKNLLESLKHIPFFLTFNPMAIELIDNNIIQMGRLSPALKNKIHWLEGTPEALIILEFEGATSDAVLEKIKHFHQVVAAHSIGDNLKEIIDPHEMESVWSLRKSGLGLLLAKRSYSRAIAFIEDISVAPEKLSLFMEQFILLLKKYGKEAGIYGHVGSGCMHIRPYIDLRYEKELQTVQSMMLDVANLLQAHGGALSGEHGDGFIRSWLNEKMFGTELYQAFIDLKRAFDPTCVMNPGKIVTDQHTLHPFEQLRLSPEIAKNQHPFPTFLDFNKEGGFELAVDLCNGNGQCRKKEGTMCPSFQATGDEYDTTRARAQALRSIINGRLQVTDLTYQGVHDVLDLCLQCKGCKTECPSQVDMAKIKEEFLFHYQEKYGYKWRNRLFANLGYIQRIGSLFPTLYNRFQDSFFMKWFLKRMKISTERPIPPITTLRFSTWWKQQLKDIEGRTTNTGKEIVLFNDTYTEFQNPEIGKAAIKILQTLGFNVIIPPWTCCGRPHLSKGLLAEAKKMAKEVVKTLYPYACAGIPIVGLEPSCILTLCDDYSGLLGSDDLLATVLKQCMTFDQFLDTLKSRNELTLNFIPLEHPKEVKIHGHCYEKALVGTQAIKNVLKTVPHFIVSEIPSGCCGMAGSFGYEQEHYAISMKIGELKLFPTIRASSEETIIVANGISCRSQITHGTSKRPIHLAELLASQINV